MMSNAPKTPLLATADTRILGPWRVRVGFTSREAGNLGLHVDDELGGGMDASMVRTLNRRAALEEALGAGPFFYLNQVHGVEVARPEDYAPASYAPGTPAERTVERARAIAKLAPVADAAVSVEGRPLAIMVADCIPVVLVGSVEGEKTVPVLAVAHAGRRGLLDGVLQTTVARMRELGAARITAWLGPSICGACYEVPEAMRAESTELIPQVHSVTGANTPGLDLLEWRYPRSAPAARTRNRACTRTAGLRIAARSPGASRVWCGLRSWRNPPNRVAEGEQNV